jgi:uncharacterized membrane protein YhaH (DUF805 family)
MRYNLGIIGTSAASLVASVTIFMVLITLWPALAQSAVPLRDRGRFHGYVGARPHWCTWSAAKVCGAWRARGGKFICPPGNMSMSCRLQRGDVR